MTLSTQEVTLDTSGPDTQAVLVFREERLLAVLCRLSDIHGELAGQWFVEAVFNELPGAQSRTFDSLPAAEAWLADGA
jgi:hypothetical protein